MGAAQRKVDVGDFRAPKPCSSGIRLFVSAPGSGQEPIPRGGRRRQCRTMWRKWREQWGIQTEQQRRNMLLTMTCRVSWPIRHSLLCCVRVKTLPPCRSMALLQTVDIFSQLGKEERRKRRRKFTSYRVSFESARHKTMSDRLSSSSVERPSSSGSPFMQLTQTNRTFHSDLPKEEHDMVVRRVQVMDWFARSRRRVPIDAHRVSEERFSRTTSRGARSLCALLCR
jgi:hypothetical protein